MTEIMTNFTAADMLGRPKPRKKTSKPADKAPVEAAQTASKTTKKASAVETKAGKK